MQMHMTMTSCGAAVVDQDNEHSELLCLWRWCWRAHRAGDDAPSGDVGRGCGKRGIQGEWRLQGTPWIGEWRLRDLFHRHHCHLHWRRANKGVRLDDAVLSVEGRDPLPPRFNDCLRLEHLMIRTNMWDEQTVQSVGEESLTVFVLASSDRWCSYFAMLASCSTYPTYLRTHCSSSPTSRLWRKLEVLFILYNNFVAR
jgi:hypothetical protein